VHNGRLHDGAGITCIPESWPPESNQKRDADHVPRTPNGLPLSRRARRALLPKKQRSRARSGRLQRRVRRPGRRRAHATRMRQPHQHSTTPSITGVRSVSRTFGITHGTTGRDLNHAQHTTTLPRTGAQHHGRAYHTRHNGPSAPRACVPRRHNGLLHDGVGTTGLQDARFAASHPKKERRSRSPDAERVGIQLPRARWNQLSKSHRSRARRGQLHCHVRRPEPSFGLVPASADHTGMLPRWHDGRLVGITHIWNYARHHGLLSEPGASGSTFHRTCFPHHGRAYHTGTTCFPHNGPADHACTTGAGTPEPVQRTFGKRDSFH